MSLTFGNEQELLDKLSDSDRELAQRDLIMFGMYCVEEVDGKARRVDVQHVELRNGRFTHNYPIRDFAPTVVVSSGPCAQTYRVSIRDCVMDLLTSDQLTDAKRGVSDYEQRWRQFMRDMLRSPFAVDTSTLPIWKKHDPGAA